MLGEETITNAIVKVPLKTLNRHGLIAGATGVTSKFFYIKLPTSSTSKFLTTHLYKITIHYISFFIDDELVHF